MATYIIGQIEVPGYPHYCVIDNKGNVYDLCHIKKIATYVNNVFTYSKRRTAPPTHIGEQITKFIRQLNIKHEKEREEKTGNVITQNIYIDDKKYWIQEYGYDVYDIRTKSFVGKYDRETKQWITDMS